MKGWSFQCTEKEKYTRQIQDLTDGRVLRGGSTGSKHTFFRFPLFLVQISDTGGLHSRTSIVDPSSARTPRICFCSHRLRRVTVKLSHGKALQDEEAISHPDSSFYPATHEKESPRGPFSTASKKRIHSLSARILNCLLWEGPQAGFTLNASHDASRCCQQRLRRRWCRV